MTKVVEGTNSYTYTYRGDGLRLTKTVNGVKTTHVWDGQQIVAELNSSGAVTNKYIRGVNQIYSQDSAGTKKYFLFNGHGDVVQLTNTSGNVIKTYDYDAFGVEKNPDSSDVNPFRYCAEYFDKETGTIYLRARYYSPSIGRFITEDSNWGEYNDPLSLNLYTYCVNNPVMYCDFTGHQPNKADSATIGQFIERVKEVEKAHPEFDSVEVLEYISPNMLDQSAQEDGDYFYVNYRYIYTEKAGWMDMQHFLCAARISAKSSSGLTVLLGFINEIAQFGDDSFFSYEDLPSNSQGAKFGKELADEEVWNSIKNIFRGEKQTIKFSEFLQKYFTNLGAIDPEEAPNWKYIPEEDSYNNSTSKNVTSKKKDPYRPAPPVKPGPTPAATPRVTP